MEARRSGANMLPSRSENRIGDCSVRLVAQLRKNFTGKELDRVKRAIAEFEGRDQIEDAGTKLAANALCLRQHRGGTAQHDLTEFEAVCEVEMAAHAVRWLRGSAP